MYSEDSHGGKMGSTNNCPLSRHLQMKEHSKNTANGETKEFLLGQKNVITTRQKRV